MAFDTETLPRQEDTKGYRFTHRFRLGTAKLARMRGTEPSKIQRRRFSTTDEFWQCVKDISATNYTTWIVSHNALFDLIAVEFPRMFDEGKIVPEWPRAKRMTKLANGETIQTAATMVIESPPTIIALRIVETGARIVFLDSLNWFPVALREMGERLGLPKLPFPDWDESDETWFEYCQRDSDILFDTFVELMRWVRQNNFGNFKYTAPSQAMAAYRHRYMKQEIYIHDNMEVKMLERKGYFGGRTEVFRKGSISESVFQVDVNSLFPSVMQYGSFPCILDRFDVSTMQYTTKHRIDWPNAVAAVRLCTNEPIFPMRTKGCILYPVGEFETVLCGEELAYAQKMGYITAVASWAEYRTTQLFTDWVTELYSIRQAYKSSGDMLYDDFTKRLLNSLYGKFGERAPKWVNVDGHFGGLPWTTWTEFDRESGNPVSYRMIGYQCQRKQESVETMQSFVAVSAFVTAAARVRMNNLRATAGKENVYYQGVDGLIVNNDGLGRLDAAGELHSNALGKLRVVHSADTGDILGCSDYRLGDRVIIAGRARATQALADGSILQRKFYAANALFCGQPIDYITEELQEWKRGSMVRKGVVGSDGWVQPFVLGDTANVSAN